MLMAGGLAGFKCGPTPMEARVALTVSILHLVESKCIYSASVPKAFFVSAY